MIMNYKVVFTNKNLFQETIINQARVHKNVPFWEGPVYQTTTFEISPNVIMF